MYHACCRIPNGLQIGQYKLNGSRARVDPMRGQVPPPHDMAYGFGLTSGIPDEIWEPWWRDNQLSSFVTAGLVFGSKDLMEVRRFARDHAHRGLSFGQGAPAGPIAL